MLLEMKDICKDYPQGREVVHALRSVDLSVDEGDYLAIMGPSGSGKTTLMNIIGCLDTPTSGRYILDGEDISAAGDNRLADVRNRLLGFVFQSFNLLPKLTARDNVALPLLYAGVGKKERSRRAEKALEAVGLGDRMGFYPTQLSGGQQQRVAIARALAKNPKLLLCDEPTGALDYNTGKQILKLLQDTCRDTGRTVAVVTHNSAFCDIADRVIRIRSGRAESVEVNEHPQSAETLEW